MTKTTSVLWMAGLALPILVAGVAQAQHYGPNGPPVAQYGAGQDDDYPPPPPPPTSGDYGAQPQSQSPTDMARYLRNRLGLRPDQDVALNSFVQAVAPPPGLERRMQQDQVAARTMTTPQRLDMMISETDEMRRVMLSRAQATKQFYAGLTPDQQHAFDEMGAEGVSGSSNGYRGQGEPPGGPNAAFGNGGPPNN